MLWQANQMTRILLPNDDSFSDQQPVMVIADHPLWALMAKPIHFLYITAHLRKIILEPLFKRRN